MYINRWCCLAGYALWCWDTIYYLDVFISRWCERDIKYVYWYLSLALFCSKIIYVLHAFFGYIWEDEKQIANKSRSKSSKVGTPQLAADDRWRVEGRVEAVEVSRIPPTKRVHQSCIPLTFRTNGNILQVVDRNCLYHRSVAHSSYSPLSTTLRSPKAKPRCFLHPSISPNGLKRTQISSNPQLATNVSTKAPTLSPWLSVDPTPVLISILTPLKSGFISTRARWRWKLWMKARLRILWLRKGICFCCLVCFHTVSPSFFFSPGSRSFWHLLLSRE